MKQKHFRIALLISFVLFLPACALFKGTIYKIKGLTKMSDQLFPEVVTTGTNFSEAASLDIPGKFACTKNAAEFGIGSINEHLKFSYEPIVKNFPNDAVGQLETDPSGNIMWGKTGYRGFFAVDKETKSTVHWTAQGSNGEYEEVGMGHKTDLPGKILLLQMVGNILCYGLFDIAKQELIYASDSFSAEFMKISKNKYLIEEINGIKPPIYYIADLNLKGLMNKVENKLTKTLCEKGIRLYGSRVFNAQKRIFIGFILPDIYYEWFLVKWKEDFSDVSVIPLIMQFTKEYNYSDNMCFSQDGEWIVTAGEENLGGGNHDRAKLIFYHVNDKYPQGISLPVYAGYTMCKNNEVDGCFVNHPTFGMLFIELAGNTVLVYKMRDTLPIIAKKMAEMAKGK